MEILKHAHSGLRWLVLASLLFAIFNALGKTNGSTPFTEKDKKLGLFALIFTHTQFLIGLVLYSISPKVVFSGASMKDSVLRFFLVEHILIMLIAVVLITIGYSKSKKAQDNGKKFKLVLIFYLIGLVIMLAGIPWPFQNYGTSWF
ncbi:cytochrome B [Fulvivirga sp. M361]|uniref:cytochrome B n=1 Tax=Fulvivirga sp. M361 TaxID=2594266 RepID=UPI001179EF0C|nr:cytochrome B [Fulvivirga sp. M361]TRX48584.1 cytochrome B [Fulvivirga sp. M361]